MITIEKALNLGGEAILQLHDNTIAYLIHTGEVDIEIIHAALKSSHQLDRAAAISDYLFQYIETRLRA